MSPILTEQDVETSLHWVPLSSLHKVSELDKCFIVIYLAKKVSVPVPKCKQQGGKVNKKQIWQ